MAEQAKTFLRSEDRPMSEDVLGILEELSADDKKEMLVFMQGIRFARGFSREPGEAVRTA